jgi:hypothetical protein
MYIFTTNDIYVPQPRSWAPEAMMQCDEAFNASSLQFLCLRYMIHALLLKYFAPINALLLHYFPDLSQLL